MSDNKLLLAISDIFNKKLEAKIVPLENEIKKISNEQHRINLIIENEIREDIKLLSENYLPAAQKYEKASANIESLQADVNVMKQVIGEHSSKLKKLA